MQLYISRTLLSQNDETDSSLDENDSKDVCVWDGGHNTKSIDGKIWTGKTRRPAAFPRWPEETGLLHRSEGRRRLQTEVPSGGADVLLSSGFIAGNSSTSWERTFTKERRFISPCSSQANKRRATWTGEETASLESALSWCSASIIPLVCYASIKSKRPH